MKVVCINSYFSLDGITDLCVLTKGKIYDVLSEESTIGSGKKCYVLMNDYGIVRGYFVHRFITIKEYRKKKLEKISKV